MLRYKVQVGNLSLQSLPEIMCWLRLGFINVILFRFQVHFFIYLHLSSISFKLSLFDRSLHLCGLSLPSITSLFFYGCMWNMLFFFFSLNAHLSSTGTFLETCSHRLHSSLSQLSANCSSDLLSLSISFVILNHPPSSLSSPYSFCSLSFSWCLLSFLKFKLYHMAACLQYY